MKGTIIHGTGRVQDLVPAFGAALQGRLWVLRDDAAAHARVAGHLAEIKARVDRADQTGYWESDDAHWDLEWMFNELSALAPPGTYFGAHPGDGSDYGFWDLELLNPEAAP